MDIRDMAAEESTRTSNVIKEQHKKHEKFIGHFFFFKKRKPVLKEKTGMIREWLRKE